MKKKALIFSILIVIIFIFGAIVNYLKPDDDETLSFEPSSKPLNTSTQAQPDSFNTLITLDSNRSSSHSQALSASLSSDSRKQSMDDLQLFFESNPKNEADIIKHLNQALMLNPIELSLNIIPYINHNNPTIQVLALSALSSSMQNTEQESKDPSFIDHRNQDLRKNIGDEINLQLKRNPNPELLSKIIAVYDRTNPSMQDTETMIQLIYEKNQYKTPTDMEIYYIKTGLKQYPEIFTQTLKTTQYAQINHKLSESP